MKRIPIITSTTALAASAGLVLAVSGAGTASPALQATSHHHRLSFTAHTLSSVQAGHTHLIESDKAVKSGNVIGYTANTCTFDFDAGKAHCFVTFARPKGQLWSKVTVDAQTGESAGRIVGGTGAYHGAKGTVTGQQGADRDSVHITLRWTD